MSDKPDVNGFEKSTARLTEIERAPVLADPARFIAAAPRT